MTTSKNDVFNGLCHENCYLVGELTFWEGFLLVGGMKKSSASGEGDSTQSPSSKKDSAQ